MYQDTLGPNGPNGPTARGYTWHTPNRGYYYHELYINIAKFLGYNRRYVTL